MCHVMPMENMNMVNIRPLRPPNSMFSLLFFLLLILFFCFRTHSESNFLSFVLYVLLVVESTTAGITIQAPQLDINTVAAGGGSMLFFRSGLFVVGPESASAHPGPACYRKGGPLTVTDANLILGRLLPEYFPKIFGPNENEPLDYEITKKKFTELQAEINEFLIGNGQRTVNT